MTWIVSDPEHLGGSPRVRDTRIAVALLLEWLAVGMTISEIVKEYPSLTEEAIRGTLEELAHSDLCFTRDAGFAHNVRQIREPTPVKVLRVIVPQQRVDVFVPAFVDAFLKSNWSEKDGGTAAQI